MHLSATHDPVGLAAISRSKRQHGTSLAGVVHESFGPWPLWLRRAASLPHIDVLPLTVDVAIESEQLGDSFPPDPADCLIAATARVHGLTLITSDTGIRKCGAVRTLW